MAVTAFVAVGGSGARADLMIEGNFESPGVGGGGVPGWPSGEAGPGAGGSGNTFDTISQTVTGQLAGRRYVLSWNSAGRSALQRLSVLFHEVVTGRKTEYGTGWPGGFVPAWAAGTGEPLSTAALHAGSGSSGNDLDAVTLDADAP